MFRRAVSLVAIALITLALAAPACGQKECTMQDQCPAGDECSYFPTDKDPLCQRNMAKKGLKQVCERETLLGAGRTGVFCPAGR